MFQNNKFFIGQILRKSADISSYPELLFVLRLANAFSTSKSVRLMVLMAVIVNIVLECRFAFGNERN